MGHLGQEAGKATLAAAAAASSHGARSVPWILLLGACPAPRILPMHHKVLGIEQELLLLENALLLYACSNGMPVGIQWHISRAARVLIIITCYSITVSQACVNSPCILCPLKPPLSHH
jgi:hypothetical protein